MAKEAFSREEQSKIIEAIQEAERSSSGEIRIHIENHCKEDVMDRAAYLFEQLEMHKTEARNGVLFYFALKDHQFAILADVGINQKVEADFWDKISQQMTEDFKADRLIEGICSAIKKAGNQLKEHFPFQADDNNELDDEISFGKN
jgi:uncharacterized membrane protein